MRYRDGKWQAINSSTGKVDGTPDASLTTMIEYAIAQGATHIYVKGAGTWTPTNNTISGIRIEGEDAANFKIYAANPDADYLYLRPGCQLVNLTVKDKSGLEQGLSPNADRRIGFCINDRPTSNSKVDNWTNQFLVINQGEMGLDQPGIGVNNFGKGDAIFLGVESYGVGLNVFQENHDSSSINGQGIAIQSKGHGMGLWACIKPGATSSGLPLAPLPTLIALTTEMDGVMLNLYTLVDTTTDINITCSGKTDGAMINLYQDTSAFAGKGLMMNFGCADPVHHTGSFSGRFINFMVDNVDVFFVDYKGHVAIDSKAVTGGPMLSIYSDAATDSSVTGLNINAGVGAGAFKGDFIVCQIDTVNKFLITANGSIIIDSTLASGESLISLYDEAGVATSNNGIEINFTVGSGAYTGKFLKFEVGVNQMFAVDADGNISITNKIASGQLLELYNNAPGAATFNGLTMNFGVVAAWTGRFISCQVNGNDRFLVDYNGLVTITNLAASGTLINLYVNPAASCSANGLMMNFEVGSGAYSGLFLSCQVGGVTKFQIDAKGHPTITSVATTGAVMTITAAGANFLEFYNSGLRFKVDSNGNVRPSGYEAADGTTGSSADITPQNSTTVLHFKNGLFVGID
jgi:hypothetical protein